MLALRTVTYCTENEETPVTAMRPLGPGLVPWPFHQIHRGSAHLGLEQGVLRQQVDLAKTSTVEDEAMPPIGDLSADGHLVQRPVPLATLLRGSESMGMRRCIPKGCEEGFE